MGLNECIHNVGVELGGGFKTCVNMCQVAGMRILAKQCSLSRARSLLLSLSPSLARAVAQEYWCVAVIQRHGGSEGGQIIQ